MAAFFDRRSCLLFAAAFAYALLWQAITPLQYNGDSSSYYNLASMLLGGSSYGMPLIYRSPGYPFLLALTGVTFGIFHMLLLAQALFAGGIALLMYQIMRPESPRMAFVATLVAILSGVIVVHSSQVMTESLFMFLLFLGLWLAAKLVRGPIKLWRTLAWFTIVFAALNTVRPITGPIFWVMLLGFAALCWQRGIWHDVRRYVIRAALLYMALMMGWVIADDVVFAVGARYSPSNSYRVADDSYLTAFRYDRPFTEAYYDNWRRRVEQPEMDATTLGTLADRPVMAKVRDVVKAHLVKHQQEIMTQPEHYPPQLFGAAARNPDALVARMFAEPNPTYADYVRNAVATSVPTAERLQLFDEAANEAGRDWAARIFYRSPKSFFMGPVRGNGAMWFALAFGPLRFYEPHANWQRFAAIPSLVDASNGPASQLMLATLTQVLRNHPEFWVNPADKRFAPFKNNPEGLVQSMLAKPTYEHAWFITNMLWQTMGYDHASALLGMVADETFAKYRQAKLLRQWTTTLMVVAGPGEVEFDTGLTHIAQAEIYAYSEAPELKPSHLEQLRAARVRYAEPYLSWQAPTQTLLRWFYYLKPVFFITSMLAIVLLWARGKSVVVPLMLLLPYAASTLVYGMLVTPLVRYTNPTILLPMMVSMMALPTLMEVVREQWKARKHRY